MNLEEIIKDLEHTINYFEKPVTGMQIGRKYQAEKTLKELKLLNIDDVSKSLECNHSRWWKLKNTIIGTICFKCRYK